MYRAPHKPSLTDGTAMVKFHSVRDVNNLLSAAPASIGSCVECSSLVIRAVGCPSDEISAHLTRVEFVTPPGRWRQQCLWEARYCGGARYNHFGEFSEESLMRDSWLTEKMELSDSESEIMELRLAGGQI